MADPRSSLRPPLFESDLALHPAVSVTLAPRRAGKAFSRLGRPVATSTEFLSSGTWVAPPGVTQVWVTVWGGDVAAGAVPGGGGGGTGGFASLYGINSGAGANGLIILTFNPVWAPIQTGLTYSRRGRPKSFLRPPYIPSGTFDTTTSWTAPPGVHLVTVKAWGGGGGGGAPGGIGNTATSGGGGGAFASGVVPVTPGNTYTVTVGAGGGPTGSGGNSSFVGDSVSVIAVGGPVGNDPGPVSGGQASSSTGTTKFSGGGSGIDTGSINSGGGGGGGGAGDTANGSSGTGAFPAGAPGAGGAGGVSGGGRGGDGNGPSGAGFDGTVPGGAGGGRGSGFGASSGSGARGQVVLSWGPVASVGTLATSLTDGTQDKRRRRLPRSRLSLPTVVGAATGTINLPFIPSTTEVFPIFSVFSDAGGVGGPGNGGEVFSLQLAPNGTSSSATLASNMTITGTLLNLTGDGGLPSSGSFCLTVDSELIYVARISSGNYGVLRRGLGNTTVASHAIGATATWDDSYEQAIAAGAGIAHNFTANIDGSGSTTYTGWLICFDSSQGYLGTDRYPMHVSSVLGVFTAGTGSGGTNRLDAAQPNAVSTPTGISDDCPTALSNPARITTDIAVGDVAVVRFTNPAASIVSLGPRSVSLQSWFGLKRVTATDVSDPTNPNAYVVDTDPGTGQFAACAQESFLNPSVVGINPATGAPTDRAVAYTSTTLLGSLRFFTDSIHYNEKGWPIACMAVRNGLRRIPFWQSYDWRDYNYVYTGFGTDCTYAQLVINRNGIVFGGVPTVNLPNSSDITGTDAMWDDGSYYFGVSWYVALFDTPYLVIGPSIGGTVTAPTTTEGFAPGVGFDTGGSPGSATTTVPSTAEGGSGGGIEPPSSTGTPFLITKIRTF